MISRSEVRAGALAVLPTEVVNAAHGWPVAEAAVGPPAVVVANDDDRARARWWLVGQVCA
jgi:hypothetical protein